ncbi:hypothetical protein [Haloferax profundi]|uniref:Uncharacterized protein n=1 Tax=Haloferax profundi TaxID=1544718 RepID=A0A0W1ST47_9EURY|nr:hypothetical protein [Haloferax profundi]KTG29502.1 hypothetical protein AUR66_10125 [Haloferax profundi]
MADDKFELTRRKALLSLGTIGVASATGASAWARFTDREKKIFEAEAGRLDLRFQEIYHTDNGYEVGSARNGPVKVKFRNLKNRDWFKHCEYLTNVGTVPGDKLSVKLKDVEDLENTSYEMEESKLWRWKTSDQNEKEYRYLKDYSDGKGELSKFLNVCGFIWCMVNGTWQCRPVNFDDGTVGEVIQTTDSDPHTETISNPFTYFKGKLNDLEGKKVTIDFKDEQMDPDEKCLFCVFGSFDEDNAYTMIDGNKWYYQDANIAMSDKTIAKVGFELIQDEGDKVNGEASFPNNS